MDGGSPAVHVPPDDKSQNFCKHQSLRRLQPTRLALSRNATSAAVKFSDSSLGICLNSKRPPQRNSACELLDPDARTHGSNQLPTSATTAAIEPTAGRLSPTWRAARHP